MARGQQSKMNFRRDMLHTVDESDRFWIGVEKWTVTDDHGDRTFDPILVKREVSRDPNRTGKAKGFNLAELETVLENIDIIKAAMRGEEPEPETRATPF